MEVCGMTDSIMIVEAERLLEDEWSKAHHSDDDGSTLTRCPLVHLLPQMLRLVEERHDHKVQDLASAVRQLVLESVFDDIGPNFGDSADMDDAGYVTTEQNVKILLRVLEKLRRSALRRGQWSDLPVTPQMFG